MTRLDVYRDEKLVGHLTQEGGGVSFRYAADHLEVDGRPISASLPLRTSSIAGEKPKAFFGNLLPEGDIRESLCLQNKLEIDDDLGLLAKIGAECAGALVILPAGQQPVSTQAPFEDRYSPIEDAYEFGQLIDALRASPSAEFKGVVTRMSLAGAQAKTVIARFGDERLFRATGGATTHVVKLGSRLNHRGEEAFPGAVFNEYFCSKLAEFGESRIPRTELLPFQTFRNGPFNYVFCIERYDRRPHNASRTVARFHQEDFCQALGRPRTHKYEINGGPSLGEMFSFIRDPDQIIAPVLSQRKLLDAVLLNLIIGNRDSHAKNYSLLRSGFKAEFAPLYDLVCTDIYENLDGSLPQRIGGADRLEAVTRQDFDLVADQVGIRPRALVRRTLSLCEQIEKRMASVITELRTQPFFVLSSPTIEKVVAAIERNVGFLRGLLP